MINVRTNFKCYNNQQITVENISWDFAMLQRLGCTKSIEVPPIVYSTAPPNGLRAGENGPKIKVVVSIAKAMNYYINVLTPSGGKNRKLVKSFLEFLKISYKRRLSAEFQSGLELEI